MIGLILKVAAIGLAVGLAVYGVGRLAMHLLSPDNFSSDMGDDFLALMFGIFIVLIVCLMYALGVGVLTWLRTGAAL